jgi:Cof subfamily protein (haloacid dehalogenase superfamily)
MAIKLIALDLDGTLLTSEKVVSSRTKRALRRAMDSGVYVTIATGRMLRGAVPFGREIGANAPLICCNGAVVQGMEDTEPAFQRCLPDEVARRLLSFCHAHGWYMNWYIGGDIFVESYRPEYFRAYRTIRDFAVREVGEDFLSYAHQVIQCVIRDLTGRIDEKVKMVEQEFGSAVYAQQNAGLSADLTPPGVTKALGLSFLMKRLGLSPAEVMACGDSDNDLSMLRLAGTAVVPENGLAEAKALASYRAASNDEDGIAEAIERLVLC